jgi:multicomponent Na+:H+ antiporter subunit B
MSLIVRTITRLTVGLILLYGIYIVTHGHLTPGGGFAGGVIIALSLVHLMLAFGKETAFKTLSKSGAAILESVGALMFVGIALLGFIQAGFFHNLLPHGKPFDLFSAGIIPLCNIAIALKVGAGLFSIFLAVVFLRVIGSGRDS